MHSTTVVIGAGRVGTVVAARLGARLVAHGEPADLGGCRLLAIATPDAAIAEVCSELAPRLEPGAGVVHFSGATSIEALAAAAGPRACVHPLQTVWADRGAGQLEGAHAAVTGDWELGAGLARDLGMIPFALADEAKPVYHAASVFASNYLVTLTHAAVDAAPARRPRARGGARPPCGRSSTARIDVAGLPPTGPIARGDAATIAAHLRAVGPELEPLYRALGRATLPLVSPAAADAVRELL